MPSLERPDPHHRLQRAFLEFSESCDRSPMYRSLSALIAADEDLLEMAMVADPRQPVPNLFLAAVNYLLYRYPEDSLASFYPNHSGLEFSLNPLVFEKFKLFCLKHDTEILTILKTRFVQTNEVNRSALFLPALALIGQITDLRPLSLIDIGAASGLNLLLDQYHYEYSDGTTGGSPHSPLTIHCEVRGGDLPEVGQLPLLHRRIGIDLNPLDMSRLEDEIWGLSLIWPDQTERLQRLKSALRILKKNKLELIQGSANQVLSGLLGQLPDDSTLCLLHSFSLNQFSPEDRDDLEQLICRASKQREIWRLGLEWIDTLTPELRLESYDKGEKLESHLLATCHHHGDWLDWKV